MKNIMAIAIALFAVLGSFQEVGASDLDIAFTTLAKKVEGESNSGNESGGVMESKEKWGYEFTIENKTFKDFTNLDVKYIVFYRQEQLGTKTAAQTKHKNGSKPVPVVKSHDKVTLNTDAIELKKSHLV